MMIHSVLCTQIPHLSLKSVVRKRFQCPFAMRSTKPLVGFGLVEGKRRAKGDASPGEREREGVKCIGS